MSCRGQQLLEDSGQIRYGESEDFGALHPEAADRSCRRWSPIDIEQALMLPIGMQSGGQNTAIFILYRLQYHCPSAIAEQDTGRAIIPIHNAAHGFRADNERAVGHSAPEIGRASCRERGCQYG